MNKLVNVNIAEIKVAVSHIFNSVFNGVYGFAEKRLHKFGVLFNHKLFHLATCCGVARVENKRGSKRNIHAESINAGVLMKHRNIDADNVVCLCKFVKTRSDFFNVAAGKAEAVDNRVNNSAAYVIAQSVNADLLVVKHLCGGAACNGLKRTRKEELAVHNVEAFYDGVAGIAKLP